MNHPERQQNSLLLRLATNAVSLLTSDVLNKATTLAVYMMVSRYLGDGTAFGQLSLGLLLLYTFQVFATVGLPTLVTREVAKRPVRACRYILNGSITVGLSGLVATIALVGFCWLLQYDSQTTAVISILALGLLPYALATVTEAIFRARETMHYIALANVPANLAKLVGAYYVLEQGWGVMGVAWLLLACRAAIILLEWVFIAWSIEWTAARFDYRLAKKLALWSSTFLGIDGVIAIWVSVDGVLLSKLAGVSEVGLYSAACQLLVPVALVNRSVVGSIFPVMCRLGKADQPALARLAGWLFEFLITIGLPATIGLLFLAESLLYVLYGNIEFVRASGVVRVLAGVLLLRALTAAFGHALWASGREKTVLRIVIVNLAFNFVVGSVLIWHFGLMGAAWASLVTWITNAAQHAWACRELLAQQPPGRELWKTGLAGLAMALAYVAIGANHYIVSSLTAVATYMFVAAVMYVLPYGGLREFRSAYFAPLMK